MKDEQGMDSETRATLERVRKTVADSKVLLAQVERRMAETDEMLAKQGLTREQVEAMSFTPEQIDAVNEELKRRGMQPLDPDEILHRHSSASAEDSRLTGSGRAAEPNLDSEDSREDMTNRRRKFNVMMNNFRL